MLRRLSAPLAAIAAGLVLADASVVALALPPLLKELSTTVEGVAAVIGVYTLVLTLGLLPAAAVVRRAGARAAGAGGLAVFALASVVCAVASTLGVLLAARAVQAAGGAVGLVAAFDVLEAGAGQGSRGRRLWLTAAVAGTAAGPAIGGALTQALDWRAIFAVQAPIAALAAASFVVSAPKQALPLGTATPWSAEARRAAVALGLVAASLTAVLFLLVLELVAGWGVAPLAAAAAVSVLPLSALVTANLGGGGEPGVRAAAGAVLLGAGTLTLAFLPSASVWWTVPPQLLAGAGMGLALPALAGELLPEHTTLDAARALTARHAGIVIALAVLAPIVSSQLDHATERAKLRGTALVLDAPLPPQDKLSLAPDLLKGVDAEQPREGLRRAIDAHRGDFSGAQAVAFDHMAKRADETLVTAVGEAFRSAFLVTGAFALLAAFLLAVRLSQLALLRLAPFLAALALFPVYAALHAAKAPQPVAIRDPCKPRPLPQSGGLTGALQTVALRALDRAACRYGSSREELVLALADPAEAKRFQKKYGVDPRSIGGLLSGLIG